MSELPPIIFRVPRLFYIAAALFFAWSFWLTHMEIGMTTGTLGRGDPVVTLGYLRGLYQAALEAVYIAANGVIVQVLLAIWAAKRQAGNSADPRDEAGQ